MLSWTAEGGVRLGVRLADEGAARQALATEGEPLPVVLEAHFARGEWRAEGPGPTPDDVARLAAFLEALAQEAPSAAHVRMEEPTLRVEALGRAPGVARVRVFVEGELRPDWAPARGLSERDLFADFLLTPEQLRTSAKTLRATLERLTGSARA